MNSIMEEILQKDDVVSNNGFISLYDLYNNVLKEVEDLYKFLRNDNYNDFVFSDDVGKRVFLKEIKILNVSYNCNEEGSLIEIYFLFDEKNRLKVDLIKDYDTDEIRYETSDLFCLRFIDLFILDNLLLLVDCFDKLESFYKKYNYDIVNCDIIDNDIKKSCRFNFRYLEGDFDINFLVNCGVCICYRGQMVDNSDELFKKIKILVNKLDPLYKKQLILNSNNDSIVEVSYSKKTLEDFQGEMKSFLEKDEIGSNDRVISLYDLYHLLVNLDNEIRENLYLDNAILTNGRVGKFIVNKLEFFLCSLDSANSCINVSLKFSYKEMINFFAKNKDEFDYFKLGKYINDDAIFINDCNESCLSIANNNIKTIEELYCFLDYIYDVFGEEFFRDFNITFEVNESIFCVVVSFYTLNLSVENYKGCIININLRDRDDYGDFFVEETFKECRERYRDEILKRIGVNIEKLDVFYKNVVVNRDNSYKKYQLKKK